jgi:hypothetical protein
MNISKPLLVLAVLLQFYLTTASVAAAQNGGSDSGTCACLSAGKWCADRAGDKSSARKLYSTNGGACGKDILWEVSSNSFTFFPQAFSVYDLSLLTGWGELGGMRS